MSHCRFEEDNFIRLLETRKDRKRREQLGKQQLNVTGLEDLADFGTSISALHGNVLLK